MVRVEAPLLVKVEQDGEQAILGLEQAEGIVIWCPCLLIQDGCGVPLDLAAVRQDAYLGDERNSPWLKGFGDVVSPSAVAVQVGPVLWVVK